jgi:prepilin-type N-terminal cleavage/methylation domain-containing protein
VNRNSKLKIKNSKLFKQGFTLVELIIVVAILGILAAIVLPEFQGHIQQAKESTAKDNLRILREAIERYVADHNGVPPGYANGNTSQKAANFVFVSQLIYHTTTKGQISFTKSATYCYGPYLPEIPKNTFNNLSQVTIVLDGVAFPGTPATDCGWMYQGSTKTIRLAYEGTDSEGKSYFLY